MISEGSCDPEDWSNYAENSALHHINKWYSILKKETNIRNCNKISQYNFFLYFWLNKYNIDEQKILP